jgi:hypothetical protein
MATQWTAQGITSGAVLPAATLQSIGAVWETYTPTLTASTTNPNIGTTGIASGRYARVNKIVVGQASFTFNGAGIAAGLGFYFCSLPITAQAAGVAAGVANAIDVSTFASIQNSLSTDTTTRLIGIGTGGASLAGSIQSTTFVWAAGDFIRFTFCYEAA